MMKRLIIIPVCIGFPLVFFYFFAQKVKPFFDTYEKVIAGISYAAVVYGLLLTIVQIRAGNKQARANTTYQIHKDGRALLMSIDEDVLRYIRSSENEPYPDDIKRKGEMQIHEILMYCVSVYNQRKFKNIETQYYKNVFLKELRAFLKLDKVKKYWKENISGTGLWDSGFVKICEEQLLN